MTGVNDAPVAVGDSYTTGENTPLTVGAPGVLANDTDGESDPLNALVVTGPAHGSLSLNINGSFTYTPAGELQRIRQLHLPRERRPGAVGAAATVAISVVHVNVPPSVNAGANQTITLPIDTASLSGTASDSDGVVSSTLWAKVSGIGTVTFANANALATTATFPGAGTYVLSLTATDNNGASTSSNVTITVNPVAVNMALKFNGTNNRVTFGAAPGLNAQSFTLETWFKREGPGVMANTGTGRRQRRAARHEGRR